MRKSSFFWFILLILWIILGVFLCWKYLCHGSADKNTTPPVGDTLQEEIKTDENLNQLGLWTFGDHDFSVTSEEYIEFFRDSSNHISPMSGELENELIGTINYLRENPNRTMTITGFYEEGETNNSILPNLGLARANHIKKFLIANSAPSGQLSIDSELTEDYYFKENILKKGIDFSFEDIASSTDRISEIEQKIKDNPITLYFEPNARTIDLTDGQRQDFADLIYYLDNKEGSQLIIKGHTDSEGSSKSNATLSNKRAVFVRDYISSNGNIPKEKMVAKGYGEKRPIASNKTSEGRANNRRVEVTIK